MSTNPTIPDEEKREYLAALERAIMRGVQSFSYSGDTVSYRSLRDMQRARDFIRAELGEVVRPVRLRPRRIVVRT